MNPSPHIALCFINYGPYHLARLKACLDRGMHISGVELSHQQNEYAWSAQASPKVRAIAAERLESVPRRNWRTLVAATLVGLNPDVCVVAGYSHPGMLAIIEWCRRRNKPVILMSDSRYEDEERSALKERVKRSIVNCCAAGFVAGAPHVAYLKSLGMSGETIFTGYDVVDNDYFSSSAVNVRLKSEGLRKQYRLPENFFLAVARFIEKKNLPCLIEAFARFREEEARVKSGSPWCLVLAGDGELRPKLEQLIESHGLRSSVILPGFVQYNELPVYYGLADAFILATDKSEQWGLVVNEAMASGLPVAVSKTCGCVPDLVVDGRNGFTFDPRKPETLAQIMVQLTSMPEAERRTMGEESQRIISHWNLDRFVDGLERATARVGSGKPKPGNILDSLVLEFMLRCR